MIRVKLTSLLEKEYGAAVHVYGFQITSVKPDSITLEIDMEISTETRSKAFVADTRRAEKAIALTGQLTASHFLPFTLVMLEQESRKATNSKCRPQYNYYNMYAKPASAAPVRTEHPAHRVLVARSSILTLRSRVPIAGMIQEH